MKVKKLSFKNYRNLKEGYICPCENINIIHGNNAQGKTNLLESIWLFTGGRSFRGSKDFELINFEDKDKAEINLDFFSKGREQNLKIILNSKNKKREIYLNNVKKKSNFDIIGNFCCVVFSPVHLSLIKDGPNLRRKFLDTAICQIKPSYVSHVIKYNKILNQRNALLKVLKNDSNLIDTLEIWDKKLAKESYFIIKDREEYILKLNEKSKEIYSGISGKKENMSIFYENSLKLKDINENIIFEILRKNLKEDLILGFTNKGIHRDDLIIKINDKNAKSYASQGQQRSAVLSLKLSEAFLLKEEIKESPILLLDDVMSELDINRQKFLLENIKNWQVFLSTCEETNKIEENFSNLKVFEINNGKAN